MKIGNMSFSEETISKMTLKAFKEAHKGNKVKVDLEEVHKAAVDKIEASKANVIKPV